MALGTQPKKAYEMIGRPQDGSLGRMHWETWLIEGTKAYRTVLCNQLEADHLLGLVLRKESPALSLLA